MEEPLTDWDRACFERAIELARDTERAGNLPIGAVISHKERIVAEGSNAIWAPSRDATRHAEMEALRALPGGLKGREPEMALYTTLEPCLMCRGAILLFGIGRVMYGAADPYGGAVTSGGTLPLYFREAAGRGEWIGPADPLRCDPLYQRALELLEEAEGRSLRSDP